MSGNNHQISFVRSGDEWQVEGHKAKDFKLKFKPGSGTHKIAFNIGTPTGRYQFNEDDPIWVKVDDGGCPQQACSYPDIKVKNCTGTQLVVENENENEVVLRYQLNVYDKNSSEWCPIDPIIDNGGHGLL